MTEACDTEPNFVVPPSGHKLSLAIPIAQYTTFWNFREVDRSHRTESRDTLTKHLEKLDISSQITNQEQLNVSCDKLTGTVQAAMDAEVLTTELCSKSKRWWTRELTQMPV